MDELIDNKRAAQIASYIAAEKCVNVMPAELEDVAPILNQKQIDRAADGIEDIDLNELASVAPFVSDKFINEFAEKVINTKGIQALAPIYPFVEPQLLQNHIMRNGIENISIDEISYCAPFLDQNFIDEIAAYSIKAHGLKSISSILPFIDEDMIQDYLMKKWIPKD